MSDEKLVKTKAIEEEGRSPHPNVDRLIEMASDKKPEELALPQPVGGASAGSSAKRGQDSSMWKILLQLRPFLPYLARLVPILDVAVGPLQHAELSSEVRQAAAQSAAKIQGVQREVSAAIQEQTLQLKRFEDELGRLQDAAEAQARAQAALKQELKSVTRLLWISAIGGAVLIAALIVMTAIRLAHHAL